ncbi:MAG TPA: PGPGW domain-containing protein [Anaeromyxobacteraceae bacterium]
MSAVAVGGGSRVRRWAALGGGYALLVVGGMLLVLPGPGLPLIIAGLALLERDAPWARRLRIWIQERLRRLRRRERRFEPVQAPPFVQRPAATPAPFSEAPAGQGRRG